MNAQGNGVYAEGDCSFTFQGVTSTCQGAVVTPDHIVAYLGEDGRLTDWHEGPLGFYRIVSGWATPRSYVSDRSGFTVGYSRADAADFSRRWPCSTLEGAGSFAFDLGGNLIDATGSATTGDGGDWLAFCEDCQRYGERKRRVQS